MDPILTVLRLGEIERPIGTYGVLIAMGMLVGAFLAARSAHRANMDVGATIAIIGFAVGGGLVGSWSVFWLVEFARTGSPMTAIENPGLVFYGGPIGGVVALVLSARKLEVPVGRLLDVTIHALPAGHAMGRLGCFFGGCCFGRYWEGPWAIRYTHPIAPGSVPPIYRHPTPLYESLLLMGLAWLLLLWKPRHVGSGGRVGIYMIGYACIRSVTELYRGDTVRGLYFDGLVSTSQLISMALFVGGCVVVVLTRRSLERVEAR